jgi:uncharacterized delta-60 repeat protein
MKTFTHTFLFLLLVSQPLLAQPGSLDDNFGTGGIALTNIGPGNSNDFAYSIAQQPDGKLLVGGFAVAANVGSFAVVRYLPDGNTDDSFGNEGIATVGFTGGFAQANEVLLQPDGKIVLVGSVSGTNGSDFALARLLPDGSLDTGFGTSGKVVVDVVGGFEIANSALLQLDGKIVAVGTVFNTGADMVLCRLNPDGSLDNGFGLGGKVITNIAEEDQAMDVALQPDGKIVVTGFASIAAIGDFALVRYMPNGLLDTGFGPAGTGIVKLDLQGFDYSDLARGVAVLPDGSILAAGLANYYNLGQIADIGVVKLDANGMLDASFGTQGVEVADVGNSTDIYDLEVLSSGHFFVAGKTDAEGNQNRWLLAKFQPDGTLDDGFGNGGIVTTALPGAQEVALGMAVQLDGKIVLAGKTGETSGADFAVARYLDLTALTATASVQNVSCFGESDGSIILVAVGGTPPYQYSLDGVNYQSNNVFDNLPAGAFSIYVQDMDGNIINFSATILEPALPLIDVTYENNQLTIIIADNTGNYQYSIDGGVTYQSSNVFDNISNITLHLVVIDEAGCEVVNNILIINATQETTENKVRKLTVWPNPSDGRFSFETNLADQDAEIRVMDALGKTVFTGRTKLGNTGVQTLDLNGLASGCYLLKVGSEERWALQKLVILK